MHGRLSVPIFEAMKRIVALAGCLLMGTIWPVHAADPLLEAAVIAAQKDAEERYRRLSADVQAIQETQELILKRQEETRQRLDKLADEFRALKDDQGRAALNYASREDLRKFVEKLKEVDDKRESDKKLILENIKDLAKLPIAAPAEVRPPRRSAEPPEEEPFIYEVKPNDNLLAIIAEYNAHFEKNGQGKITLAQVVKANPGLNPDLLFAGKKIRIPVPPKESK